MLILILKTVKSWVFKLIKLKIKSLFLKILAPLFDFSNFAWEI